MASSTDSVIPRAAFSFAEREATCPEHGRFSSRQLSIKVWSKCPACVAEQREAEETAARKADEERAERRHRAMLSSARIPARFIGRSFDNFEATTDMQRRAVTIARDYAERFDHYRRKGQGLILSGQPGTGKSHLANAILQAVLSPDVRYLTCMDLIRAVRETWRKDSPRSESEVLAYFERLDLLAIDEVGAQYGTDGEQNVIFDVLDRRYREVRPVLLLTNQDLEGFKKYVGERTYDRLGETCRWVDFQWPTYRPTARRAAT
jgi:DNA replication protein DnaC